MFYSNNHISPFVTFVYIPMSLDNLFQRIASIYDGFYLSRFNQFLE